ncbi:hypothetical protein LshimejAT787_0202020 [Lyophyllum shimeji]|uniref:Uncharacterized protein n=1 Tax=Lyophyllum shimeji TaxID=47721 RepID=A0A9P3PFV1_LYOSH|nr:hypothetical protein LshimejAT787_0202020 [Lyophyllum shimeji]
MQAKVLLAALASSVVSFANGAATQRLYDIGSSGEMTPAIPAQGHIGRARQYSNLVAVVLNSASGPLSTDLDTGFELHSGSVNVTVPTVPPGQYSITQGPFKIVAAP